jgi:hypothetical protein
MNWIDIRVRKPEEKDANDDGEVLVFSVRGKATRQWDEVDSDLWPYWYPFSDLPDPADRIPDPPEGYRFKQDGDDFDKRALRWSHLIKEWVGTDNKDEFSPSTIYVVPVEPPKPQYRAFANAAEFEPYSDRWIQRRKQGEYLSGNYRVSGYDDMGVWGDRGLKQAYKEMFDEGRMFADGTPFGLPVN